MRSWRHNPLCRPGDLAEARLTLGALLALAVCVPLAAWAGWSAAYSELDAEARRQLAERRQVWATVQDPLPRAPADLDPETASPPDEPHRMTAVWTGPDGTTRSGTIRSSSPHVRGEEVRIWTDRHGRFTTAPLSPGSVPAHALLAAFVAAALAGGAVEGGRRLGARELERRRHAQLDEEWTRTGPDWGRAGSST